MENNSNVEVKEEHEIEKIPDFILLNRARIEIGKLNSYIHELEYKLEQKEKLTHEENKEFRKVKFYKEVMLRVDRKNAIIKNLNKTVAKLIYEKVSEK